MLIVIIIMFIIMFIFEVLSTVQQSRVVIVIK